MTPKRRANLDRLLKLPAFFMDDQAATDFARDALVHSHSVEVWRGGALVGGGIQLLAQRGTQRRRRAARTPAACRPAHAGHTAS